MMKCIVCDHRIQIDTLRQLFALSPLLLCRHCEQHLIPKQGNILFEDNEWIRQIIESLNQGDIVLVNLFKNHLKAALQKRKISISNVKIIEHSDQLPYPWLEILVNDILSDTSRKRGGSTERLVISVVTQKNVINQISIIA